MAGMMEADAAAAERKEGRCEGTRAERGLKKEKG
jgi:hypothetical protein